MSSLMSHAHTPQLCKLMVGGAGDEEVQGPPKSFKLCLCLHKHAGAHMAPGCSHKD